MNKTIDEIAKDFADEMAPTIPLEERFIHENLMLAVKAGYSSSQAGLKFVTGEPLEKGKWYFCKVVNKVSGKKERSVVYCSSEGWDLSSPFEVYEYLDESAYSKQAEELTIDDYKKVLEDHRRLVRELDVIINGENAAPQASLCDIVAQLKSSASKQANPVSVELAANEFAEGMIGLGKYSDKWHHADKMTYNLIVQSVKRGAKWAGQATPVDEKSQINPSAMSFFEANKKVIDGFGFLSLEKFMEYVNKKESQEKPLTGTTLSGSNTIETPSP